MTTEQKYIPIKIDLQEPATLDSKLINSLEMRPPKAGDVFAAQNLTANTAERDALLFGNLTDTTADFMKSLAFYDYKRVEAAYGLFMCPIKSHLEKQYSFCAKPPEVVALENSSDSTSTSSTTG